MALRTIYLIDDEDDCDEGVLTLAHHPEGLALDENSHKMG